AYALSGFDGRSRLGDIDLPVLLLWGARDLLVPLRAAYSYRKRLPESELVVLNDTGHMVQIERPARFDWEIEEFAREVIGAASPVQPVLEPPDGR
ncbi:MAG: alpha/beta fold hydrolase, partial [Solirubrobacterales bacterium]